VLCIRIGHGHAYDLFIYHIETDHHKLSWAECTLVCIASDL